MFRNVHFDRLRQAFADQFSSDGRGLIYRKYEKGVPIRVSADERDRFIATYNKHLRYATWSLVPAVIAMILLLVWLAPDVRSLIGQMVIWVGIAAILMPFLAVCLWAWNAPSRELQDRTPEGDALTRDEAHALGFSKISYRQLALVPLLSLLMIWKISTKFEVFQGWGLIWVVVAAALTVFAGIQAIRKWRFEKR